MSKKLSTFSGAVHYFDDTVLNKESGGLIDSLRYRDLGSREMFVDIDQPLSNRFFQTHGRDALLQITATCLEYAPVAETMKPLMYAFSQLLKASRRTGLQWQKSSRRDWVTQARLRLALEVASGREPDTFHICRPELAAQRSLPAFARDQRSKLKVLELDSIRSTTQLPLVEISIFQTPCSPVQRKLSLDRSRNEAFHRQCH